MGTDVAMMCEGFKDMAMDAELLDARLLEVSAEAFERVARREVDFLFDAYASLPGSDHFLTAPFLPRPFIGDHPDYWAGQESPETRQTVVRALSAAFRFYQEWSAYLPLRIKNCNELIDNDNVRFNLVGWFGRSLHCAGWDDQHPGFKPYCQGLMACENTPDAIRNDPGLRIEFPACPLDGMCDQSLTWQDPELRALLRRARAMNTEACG